MEQSKILVEVSNIIRDVVGCEESVEINESTIAQDVPCWDSFNHINVIVAIETHYGIRVPTAMLEEAKNVGDLIHIVQKLVSGK